MAIIEAYIWWYKTGWSVFIKKLRLTLGNIVDFFSMSSLVRTLFKPFRQISADSSSTGDSINLKFQMFIDRLVSRSIGFFVRLLLLIIGSFIIILGAVFSLILILIWPIIPLAPIAGIILAIIGVVV